MADVVIIILIAIVILRVVISIQTVIVLVVTIILTVIVTVIHPILVVQNILIAIAPRVLRHLHLDLPDHLIALQDLDPQVVDRPLVETVIVSRCQRMISVIYWTMSGDPDGTPDHQYIKTIRKRSECNELTSKQVLR